VVDGIIARDARIESFAPAIDIAAMTQQYLHSRLFRS
jgi:urease accessory protein UreF